MINRERSSNHIKLCDYVILAEFDINTGSTVRHQYPSPVPYHKEDWFAENMLPEGVHNRSLDHTYMFLNRGGSFSEISEETSPESSAFSEVNTLSGPFLFGINLCKTRYDSSVRRGAIVKAMAVFSQFHFVEAFKKPLEWALDQYFDNPSVHILEVSY